MKKYTFQNTLVSKKQLKQILSWTFTNYGSVQGSFLADELKYLGFKYSTKAGISISIEDLRIPPIKNSMLEKSTNEILKTEQTCLTGKITEVERFEKVIETWNITSETLKDEVVAYFRNYDPLNSVYMMAFSGARGNLSQVRQLVGMRGLMSDPNGEIMDLPIKQNFREGLTITDYLMSGYGARKGIVDTALKTANSGYLTRRLIDVAQDIIIREKDCLTKRSIIFVNIEKDRTIIRSLYDRILGRILNQDILNPTNPTNILINKGTQITPTIIKLLKEYNITKIFVRSPLTCGLNRSVCQKCYGWNLANENIVDLGEAIGIIAGQSIGEPGTQLTMRTFHTGGIFTAGSDQQILSSVNGTLEFSEFLKPIPFRTTRGQNVLKTENSGSLLITLQNNELLKIEIPAETLLFVENNSVIKKGTLLGQLVETSKQTKTETKNVLSKLSGQLVLDEKNKSDSENKLAWVLSGELLSIPKNSYLNINNNLEIIKQNSISRIKLINKNPGTVQVLKDRIDFSKYIIQILSSKTLFNFGQIQKLLNYGNNNSYIFDINRANKFLLTNSNIQKNKLISINHKEVFGKLITNTYDTNTGGTPYFLNDLESELLETSVLWVPEETHIINRDSSILNVEDSEFVTENYEIVNDTFSTIPGIIKVIEKNNILQEIIIKPGFLYKIKNFEEYDQKIFYPGEIIFDNLEIEQLVFSEIINTKTGVEILIRPIYLYKIPRRKTVSNLFGKNFGIKNIFKFKNILVSNIKNKEKIKIHHGLKLFEQHLKFEFFNGLNEFDNSNLEILAKVNNNSKLEFLTSEKICLEDYIPNELREVNLNVSLTVQNNQFINSSTLLGYLEFVVPEFYNLIKLKTRVEKKSKKLLCIRDKDCTIIPKRLIQGNKIGDFINNSDNGLYTGKIIDEQPNHFIIQKGRPYFFPKGAQLFCRNGDLIEKNQNIGQLSYEKEITGDIVQGLPRVEQILEARKMKTSENRSLMEKTGLSLNYKFLKFGSSLEGEENVNLHSLLDLYFQHYTKIETLYEATYRSIKKVQGLILNLIQSVYQSQGVSISDKHLEVIIRQMTTKVKIAHEGDTPLLANELVDLEQMKYINASIENDNNKPAFYQPVLLGITRASLNTDSFISAASFQETTRVLTRAAIEGKVDWLRGLKENVIIGRLIPAGTGFNSYSDLSDTSVKLVNNINSNVNKLKQVLTTNN